MAACMVIPLAVSAVGVGQKRNVFRWGVLFLALLILDVALVYLPTQMGLNRAVGLHWNWLGKLFVLAWAVPFVAFGPITFTDAGLRMPSPGTAKRAIVVVCAALAVLVLVNRIFHTGQPWALETTLFQLTMPTIAEELVFRGVLFAVLERAFAADHKDVSGWWRSHAVWLTAIAFGLVHGWSADKGGFEFNAAPFAFSFVFGVVAGGLRKYTGSLVFPAILHSAANLILVILPI